MGRLNQHSTPAPKHWSKRANDARNVSAGWLKLLIWIVNDVALSKIGIRLVRKKELIRPEQKRYASDPKILALRDQKICDLLRAHFGQRGVEINERDCLRAINNFEILFRQGAISNLRGGMGYNNGLIFFVLLSALNPRRVVESGVWRGYSTFLIDAATADDAEILCFDISFEKLEFKSQKASYHQHDIRYTDTKSLRNIDVAFFDDHVSHYDRLNFCLDNSIDVIFLDDDVACEQVHSDGWPPIPTATMIFDYENIPHEFYWQLDGHETIADIRGLNVKQIRSTYDHIRFPSLALLTGYSDVSFTTLMIRKR